MTEEFELNKVIHILQSDNSPRNETDQELMAAWAGETVAGFPQALVRYGAYTMVASTLALLKAVYVLGVRHGRALKPMPVFVVAAETESEEL